MEMFSEEIGFLDCIYSSGNERYPSRLPVSCPICRRICSNKYNLRKHMDDKHSEKNPLMCPICAKEYSTKNSLLSHISRYHKNNKSSSVSVPLSSDHDISELYDFQSFTKNNHFEN